jgi:hypothetical protein
MFTHPALLRQVNLTVEFLRRCGEGTWARRLSLEGDAIRKSGWTEAARGRFLKLFGGDGSLNQLTLGDEHQRRLAGMGLEAWEANRMLAAFRQNLSDLSQEPTVKGREPGERVKRAADLPDLNQVQEKR